MCLHEFVSNFNFDASGNRKYTPLTKPRFVNHRIFDPNKRRNSYYRLLHDNEKCSAYCELIKNMHSSNEFSIQGSTMTVYPGIHNDIQVCI